MVRHSIRPLSLTRRSLLRQLTFAPLAVRASPLTALVEPPAERAYTPSSPLDLRYTPHYPSTSPLEDVLRLVTPGLDQFPSELAASEIETTLALWARTLEAGHLSALAPFFAPPFQASPLQPQNEKILRDRNGILCTDCRYAAPRAITASSFLDELHQLLGANTTTVELAEFQLTAFDPATNFSAIRSSLTLSRANSIREQRVGIWHIRWTHVDTAWRAAEIALLPERRSVLHGPGFIDITREAIGQNASWKHHLQNGSDYWRTTLDGASGIDVYGNNGVAVGDYNNDGFDDLYVSQPAGLPNRLFRNRGDGTLEDVTEQSGVGVLDNTACALFADLRNSGLQDLLVVTGSGPLLFLNDGHGGFTHKSDAFQFAQPPEGTFTHAAIADYDRDGRLDIYFCLYSYYLGLDQYHYPVPYFDARNGPPNFLMHNRGDATFEDRTAQSGLNAENNRYSFSCAWNENAGGHPDLYVVNDFGRNNLYRNHGDGTFTAISETAHVQDVGAGMSASWADYSNTGREAIYTANMWSAAGQRVSLLAAFHPNATPAIRELYQRHARGNALYRNDGDTFTNVTDAASVEMGRWAWGSDFFDLDRDGHADLYVTNGYITAPASETAPASTDLGSFFWRQIVGRSPDDSTSSPAYEHGWNALNELIRTDSSWSGHERNVLFVNNGDGSFTEASGPLALDFPEDGRSFAVTDLDGDGRLEIILKNRNGPQLRILRNGLQQLGDAVSFRLRGTRSNRDAIGTGVILRCGSLVQTRSLQAGSGFLSQHTKELFFGLGNGTEPLSTEIRWPSGIVQHFADLPRNSRIELVESEPTPAIKPFAPTARAWSGTILPAPPEQQIPTTFATWLLDPLIAPAFTLPTQTGTPISLATTRGLPVLIHLWSSAASAWQPQLQTLDSIPPSSLTVLALNLDPPAQQAALPRPTLRLSILFATPQVAGVYNIIFRYLHDRRTDLPLPTSFLLDREGRIVCVYQGAVTPAALLADSRRIPTTTAERIRLALPFPGRLYNGTFSRNTFTYGVALFQHGYLDEAASSFAQSIAANPANAEAHYNLGTLDLRRNRLPEARTALEQTLKLKPNYPEAWNNLGMIAAQEGSSAQAADSFRQALSLRPDYTTALLNLGSLLRHESRFAEAEPLLTRALALTPEDPEANYAVGMLKAQQGQFSAAATSLEKAIALRPNYPEALNNLGVLYAREGDNTRAEQQFLTARQLSPAYEPTYLNLARLYMAAGDRTRARAAIESLLKQNPASTTGQQALQALGPP